MVVGLVKGILDSEKNKPVFKQNIEKNVPMAPSARKAHVGNHCKKPTISTKGSCNMKLQLSTMNMHKQDRIFLQIYLCTIYLHVKTFCLK